MERIALYEEKRFKQMSLFRFPRSKCMYTGKEKIMKFYTLFLFFVLTKNKKEYILYS